MRLLLSKSAELQRIALSIGGTPSLESALRRPAVVLIAEIKRSSPSRGAIRTELDPARQAKAYQDGGAAAISVLTESERFGGTNDDIEKARRASTLPILKKDFHVDVIQLHEAKSIGASAALLIARALPPEHFREMVAAAREIDLEILAEVRNEIELALAIDAGCRIIGVNNRDLESLVIDSGRAEQLIPQIPAACIAVAESGYSDLEGIQSAARAGADAVLVGSFISASEDPAGAVRRLTGVTRVPRAG